MKCTGQSDQVETRKETAVSKDISSNFLSWKMILKIVTWFATEKLSFCFCVFTFSFHYIVSSLFQYKTSSPPTLNSAYHKSMYVCLQFVLFHRILECFGSEGAFRGHLALPPCSEQGHLLLDQVAQSPIQIDLECFQGWDSLYYLSRQPVPVFHQPHDEKISSLYLV